MIGQTLNNRYTISARLGKGAMGIVYRATDTQSQRDVALKVISSDLVADADMLERFKREGEALSKLKHPNIVEFIDAFQHDEHYVIVMEYVSGGSLHDLISKGPLPINRANRIALELCDALIRSHHLNIIHRDLKPENVLLGEDGTAKLADFGVARLSEGTRMTRSGTQVGTPYYMSPEAWEGKALDAQADIWSLGVILFEMLTGHVPFGGDTGAAVMNKVLTAPPPDLKKLRAEVTPSMIKIVSRMLTRDKKRRYQTMRQVAVDLESGQQGMTPKPGKVSQMATSIPSFAFGRYSSLLIGGILIAGIFTAVRLLSPTTSPDPTNVPESINTSAQVTSTFPARTEALPAVDVSREIDCMGAQQGDTISILYQWAGVEEEALNHVLRPLLDACGIVLEPESTRDQAILDTRVQAGNPPDVVFWQVAQLVQYQDQLQDLEELGANRDSYSEFFLEPVTVNGRWLGLPIKADVKSIIWYSPANFGALGYEVPTTWEELDALVDQMVADGQVPWSMGFESGDATGWTGTDFVQDIMLVQQGPDFVLGVIDGSVSYDDPSIQQAYETYGKWATDEAYTVGGTQGTLSTHFLEAIFKPFADPPEAMMVKQSGFAGAEIAKQFPALQQGTEYDFFVVPGIQGLQGAIEPMMAFNDTPAVRALVAYLSSPQGGANWAAATFGLSPNSSATGHYTDPALQKLGNAIAETQGFTPDIGDTIPSGFGSAEFQGVSEYVNGGDVDSILAELAIIQAEALK